MEKIWSKFLLLIKLLMLEPKPLSITDPDASVKALFRYKTET